MAQIFVSHSAKDRELVDFLSRAFAATQVKGVFEEFEALLKGPANAPRIAQDIQQSNAVFMLLGRHVEELKHTRDWVGHEGGIATAAALQGNKDIWVLESIAESDSLSVVIPYLRHYVCFDPADPTWQGYLTQVIASYDDSHVLKAIGAGAATGAAVRKAEGALVGGVLGLVFAAMTSPTRPPGLPIRCPQCTSVYNVHLTVMKMRCPVCNARLMLASLATEGQ
jgi:TIR domain